MRPGASVVVSGWSGLRKLSRGFSSARRPLRLVALSLTLSSPNPLFSGLPQSSLSSSMPYGFPYYESLPRRWFGSTAGAAIPIFSLLPPSEVYPQSVRLSSLSPNLPQQEPHILASAGPLWSAWIMVSIRTARLFLGVHSFIGNDTFTPSPLPCLSDNLQFPSRFSRPSSNCLLSAGAAHLTLVVWGGRLTSYLLPTHETNFESHTPLCSIVARVAILTLSLILQLCLKWQVT